MERIVYKKTLDVHKNGIQFTLQGFETADKMARRIELSLMASGDTIDLPLEQMEAIMYVTTPNATEPSINKCTIKDNSIIYDVLPIVEEGITEMQLKLIETRPNGASGVLAPPKFAVEVLKSNADDQSAIQSATYTSLEDAVAKAKATYDARLLRIELDADCMFRAYFADGTTYESDVLKELFLRGDVLLSQSYAKGGSGVRAGEDTDNSMYYSQLAKSSVKEAESIREDNRELLSEVQKHGVYTAFSVDFESGEVKYISPQYRFNINQENGELEALGEAYNPDDVKGVTLWANEGGGNITGITLHQICKYKMVEVVVDLDGVCRYDDYSRFAKVLCYVEFENGHFSIKGTCPYNFYEGGELYTTLINVTITGELSGVESNGIIRDSLFAYNSIYTELVTNTVQVSAGKFEDRCISIKSII